jgi:SPX domain
LVPSEDGKSRSVARRGRTDSLDSLQSSVDTESATTSAEQDHGDKTGETTAVELEPDTNIDSRFNHKKEELGRNPGEIAFFKLLHSEFKKACHFFGRAEQEFIIREERVREGMEIMKRPNSIMVNEKWSMLAKSIYRLYKDLLLLETFAIMTYCSFSKILKKHDKVTGHQTRGAFMANIVGKANFTNYPKVLEMITRCEQLYDDVSNRLLQEGKEGLYEDERLFINMISRLNDQALDNPDAPDRKEGRRPPQQKVSFSTSVSSTTGVHPLSRIPESSAVSTLRSLVEENDARAHSEVSEVPTEDDPDINNLKRSYAVDTKPQSNPKRPRAT